MATIDESDVEVCTDQNVHGLWCWELARQAEGVYGDEM
jgi:hypothetical protein